MKRIAIAVVLLLSWGGAFAAEMVHKSGDNSVRLQDRPCIHAGTLGLIRPEHRAEFRQGRATVNGHDFFMCWVLTPDGEVFMLFEDADVGTLRADQFKPEEGI